MRSARDERAAGKKLGELYAEHAAAVYAYAFHLLGTREEAEDVVQIAFLHAHRSLVRGEQLMNPRAWLSTVVKRQAFNRWRDRHELPVEDPSADRPAAEPPAEASEQLGQVRAVLFSLPEAQHQAFVLRHWSGLSTREIAQVLETSESAVESLLVRARAAILAAGPVAEACVDVREKLAAGAELTAPETTHVASCSGCGRARQRLIRVAAAAVALELAPHAHVAQALAATVPGFAAAGSGAGAATGAGLAAKAAGAKVAASLLVSAVAVTAVAPLALHHLRSVPVAPPAHARPSGAAPVDAVTPEPGAAAGTPSTPGVGGDAGRSSGPGQDGSGGKDGGGQAGDGSSGQTSGGSGDGSSSSGSGDGSQAPSSGDGGGQSGGDGSGSSGSSNVTSGDGSSSGQTSSGDGSTSGDSQTSSSTDTSSGQ